MKKTLVFVVLLAMLLPSGWVNPRAGAAQQGKTSSVESAGVRLATQQEQASIDTTGNTAQMNLLYPDDINPPESCHVPRMAPLGQDLEMMLGPWGGPNALLALDQPSSWNGEADLTGVAASTDLDVIALNTEQLVAAWADLNGKIKYATWGAGSGWSTPIQLGAESANGKPALLSRGPTHWAVFARFNTKIRVIEWYMGSLGSWKELPGIDDTASDPVVVTQDAGHMAVFYRTAAGEVKFTEWEGAWLSKPVSLGTPSEGKASFPIASELSAVSRNDNHSAVFGVDASGQLWFRERTSHNKLDWSDTVWVKLLEGAAVEKPAVTSRHANHIGVVVKDSSGQPYYTHWAWVAPIKLYLPLVRRSPAGANLEAAQDEPDRALSAAVSTPSGWSQPIPLGSATFTSPLALVPRGIDSLIVLGIRSDTNLYEIVWTEDTGWGSWQAIGGSDMITDQVLAAVTRRANDLMLLGRYNTGQVWYKHYTSLDKTVTDEALSSPLEGLPRAQTLAFVDGKWIWVSVTRQAVSGMWQAEAREISTGVTGYLDLDHADSGQSINRVAVAASDLDVDGDAEVVVATLRSNQSDIDLSVLELSFPNSTTLVISASPLYTWIDPLGGEDVNVAIGDLDGDQQRDEVVVGYRNGLSSMRFGVFHYTEYGLASQGGTTEVNYHDWCAGLPGCTVGAHDLELTIGRVARVAVPPLEREQLVVLDVANVITGSLSYAQDWILTSSWITETGSWDPPVVAGGCHLLNPSTTPGNASSIAGNPYTAGLGTGDMDADGLQNIVYSFGDRLAVLNITPSYTCAYQKMSGLPDQERSLAMGDIDTDGRSEAVVSYRGATTASTLFEMVEGNALRTSAQHTVNGGHTVLAADTDNDTQLAELAGCKTFAEIHVVGVVNGAPRWYSGGQPIQNSGGIYGRTETGGGGTTDGTSQRYGGSLTLGLEFEFNIPIAAVKSGEVRAGVTQEFMGSSGTQVNTVSAQTQEMGYEYEAASLGMVVYNSTEFTCYYYDVYPPAQPESRTRAMLCTPTGRVHAEDFKALEDWNSSNFKQAAGPSWVDVGHRSPAGAHTNNLEEPGNYPFVLPVDASRVKYTWNKFSPIKVSYASLGGFTNYWHISDMIGGETETIHSFEENTTLSVGGTIWNFAFDVAGTYGMSWERSSVTSWESTLEMGGSVEKFQDPTRLCYDIVPFVYTERAITLAGVVYPYLEMDYYVPSLPYPCAKEAQGSRAASGLDLLFPYQVQGWKGYFAFP
jgi:hypothetical protein